MFSRNALFAVALLATTALANIPGLPDCSQHCIPNDFGSCGKLNVKCICSDTTLLTTLSCCVSTSCDASDQAKVISFADSLCAGQGVTNLPTAATCAPGAASTVAGASSSSGTATGTMTMTGTASSTGTAAASTSNASGMSSTAAASSAAATESGSSAGKTYPVEGMGLGMAVLGLLVGL